MKLSFSQMIILYCLHKLKAERSIYAIYHLLHGKKSSQTIQDAHLFHLTNFFQTDLTMTRSDLENTVVELLTNEMVKEVSKQHFYVTEKGVRVLNKTLSEKPIPVYLNGWKYQRAAEVFWERLSLSVQVISHLQKHESKYIPVQKNPETQLWMRKFLKQNKLNREGLGSQLYAELVTILDINPEIDPQLIVLRLSGYQSIGLTLVQASKKLEMELSHYYYHFLNILHFMISQIEDNNKKYPILSTFLDSNQNRNLTMSTAKTYHLLNQGYSLFDVMKVRQLKKSTIEDHLVELALHINEFSIDTYVSTERQREIQSAVKALKTKQLKLIKSVVEDTNYFEIRLVLAKYGDQL